MFSKLVAMCALVAVTQAGLLPEPHYSAVSSQSYIQHNDNHGASLVAPVAKLAVAAPVTYHATPVSYHSVPVSYHTAPVRYHAAPVEHDVEQVSYPAKYEYSYSVDDNHSGDRKSHKESRDGDVVKGSYSFQEADGSIRTVEYTADPHHGFNAVVHNTAPTAAPVIIKTAPVVYKAAAPIVYKAHTPVVYKSAAPEYSYYH